MCYCLKLVYIHDVTKLTFYLWKYFFYNVKLHLFYTEINDLVIIDFTPTDAICFSYIPPDVNIY